MVNYDIIVVGGGHAGCEASLASARLNNKTLLIIPLPIMPLISGMPASVSTDRPQVQMWHKA